MSGPFFVTILNLGHCSKIKPLCDLFIDDMVTLYGTSSKDTRIKLKIRWLSADFIISTPYEVRASEPSLRSCPRRRSG